MPNFWMVRAGEAGYLFDEFERQQCVAIGWEQDFTNAKTIEDIKRRLAQDENYRAGALANAAAMVFKFRHSMAVGDKVVTYDPKGREYLLGTIQGEYIFEPGRIGDYGHIRPVKWAGRVHRDDLGAASKNTLGSTLTLFEPGEHILKEMEAVLRGDEAPEVEEEQEQEFEVIRRDTLSRSHEFIKDRILSLSADDMEELVAALLRAMGYRARVSPKGPDRGRDVLASPDGLGFQQPRIFAEVKHRRRESMGAQSIRSFVGGLRSGDRGLFVSTGGYTQEAKYEADRSSIPITLVDLDDLATLVVEHYESFDSTGRALLPLIRVFWPASRG
jgi:restriction system protein